jgi:hypothetical protein
MVEKNFYHFTLFRIEVSYKKFLMRIDQFKFFIILSLVDFYGTLM